MKIYLPKLFGWYWLAGFCFCKLFLASKRVQVLLVLTAKWGGKLLSVIPGSRTILNAWAVWCLNTYSSGQRDICHGWVSLKPVLKHCLWNVLSLYKRGDMWCYSVINVVSVSWSVNRYILISRRKKKHYAVVEKEDPEESQKLNNMVKGKTAFQTWLTGGRYTC